MGYQALGLWNDGPSELHLRARRFICLSVVVWAAAPVAHPRKWDATGPRLSLPRSRCSLRHPGCVLELTYLVHLQQSVHVAFFLS